MRGVFISIVLLVGAISCVDAQPAGAVSDVTDSDLYDCMIASNVFQQEAKLSDEVVTSVGLRRADFLIRDEWARRLGKQDDVEEWLSSLKLSEFAKRQMGNLNQFDYVGEAKARYEHCQDLIVALEERIRKELSYGDD